MEVFAQTTVITPSGNWADPASWSALAEHIGPVGFIFVFLTLVASFFMWKWGTIIVNKLFGDDGWLDGIRKNQETVAKLFETHIGKCNLIHEEGGPCNVVDMRKAGHHAAEAMRELAKGTPNERAVSGHADNIRSALRGENQ